ncbi:DUF3168 domain-containing protein [Fictibacillus phosphorivorans]|uniref:DUF3168 domain-containing protein n=1 Tax=Fictibacillus phosphorivorans TaxID=1221500 RepID=UPI0011A4F52B|nr:DUF3168 domain-containing protein [Fictibacillus phosphorivorans]
MKTAILSLQTAIYNRLSNDAQLAAKITGVYDAVDENTVFPYVTVGNGDTVNNWSTSTWYGEELTHTLHVWSRYKGKKEAVEIMNLIINALSQPLSIDGGFLVEFTQLEFMEVLSDPDDITRHGVMRYRFKIRNQ